MDSSDPSGARGGRLRVVHFSDVVNRHDFIYNVAAYCDPSRFDVTVVTLSERGSLNARPDPCRVVNLDCPARLAGPRAVFRLRRLIAREKVDLVHSHHYHPTLVAAVAVLGGRARLVVGRHYSDSLYRHLRGSRQRLYLALEGFCNARAAAVVVPSSLVEDVVLRQGVHRKKVVRIPYGLDFARFVRPAEDVLAAARREWPPGEGPLLATVGRLHSEKGQGLLIEALGRLRGEGLPFRLLVVGDGQEAASLEEIVKAWHLDGCVRLLGWRADALRLVAAADVVVQPSLEEAFSQVMLEALAVGTPLVITRVGGVSDLIQSGVSGLVVPTGDVPALCAALRSLLDPRLRRRIGVAGSQAVREKLDVRKIVRGFETLYEGVRGHIEGDHVGR